MTETRADVYSRITDQIAAAVEAGSGSYRMPWHHDGTATSRPINLASGKPYRGINVLVLWATADAHGFTQGLWGTYRQWLAVGRQVRKGERGCVVVLWKQITNGDDGDEHIEGEGHGRRAFARAFTVFNIAQIDGYTSEPVFARPNPRATPTRKPSSQILAFRSSAATKPVTCPRRTKFTCRTAPSSITPLHSMKS